MNNPNKRQDISDLRIDEPDISDDEFIEFE